MPRRCSTKRAIKLAGELPTRIFAYTNASRGPNRARRFFVSGPGALCHAHACRGHENFAKATPTRRQAPLASVTHIPTQAWKWHSEFSLASARYSLNHPAISAIGSSREGLCVDRERSGAGRRIFAGTRPRPIHRAFAETSSHGIGMDVIDLSPNGARFGEISIKAAPALPEPVSHSPVGLPIFHLPKERRGLGAHMDQGSLGYRLLERGEYSADRILYPSRPKQQMHMFRHEHISPQIETMRYSTLLNRVDHPTASELLGEKRTSLKTRKSDEMRMPWCVAPPASFANRAHSPSHSNPR